MLAIPFTVTFYFPLPIGYVCLGSAGASGTVVAMPEAAVNEDDSLEARQHQVGLAGEILAMQTETVTHAMDHAAYRKLRSCVAILHGTHGSASLFGGFFHPL